MRSRVSPRVGSTKPSRSVDAALSSARTTVVPTAITGRPRSRARATAAAAVAEKEDLDLAAGVGLLAEGPRRDHARVVDDEERALGHETGELGDRAMRPRVADDEQPRRLPLLRRPLRNELDRQLILER